MVKHMGSSIFRFKQFSIRQDKCAMKVTTDGCLFGAWAAGLLSAGSSDTILDIGTGTGLLSLMAAQQNSCSIDAAEIDPAAAEQAAENVHASPWQAFISVIQTDIRTYRPQKKYSHIITNPPFFEHQLQSPDAERSMALHATGLTLQTLFRIMKSLLLPEGRIFMLLPAYRKAEAGALAAGHDLAVQRSAMVQQTPQHSPFRMMLQLGSTELPLQEETIIIKEKDGSYTPAFTGLLKDYYLYL